MEKWEAGHSTYTSRQGFRDWLALGIGFCIVAWRCSFRGVTGIDGIGPLLAAAVSEVLDLLCLD
jgi:Holliday junction resolvasome RuvABC DNA-binding subunit